MSYTNLQDLRNLESYLLNAATTLGSTHRTVKELQRLAEDLLQSQKLCKSVLKVQQSSRSEPQTPPPNYDNDHVIYENILRRCEIESELLELHKVALSVQGYLSSVELLQARTGKLTQMV
jgi:hypothetical protein